MKKQIQESCKRWCFETTVGKGKTTHHQPPQQQHQQQHQALHEPPKANGGVGEVEKEQLPTTFIVAKNKYDYFKPRVEIETEEEANRVFVKELYIRGWLREIIIFFACKVKCT